MEHLFIHLDLNNYYLVVLYYDKNKNERYPSAFILINNKTEVGYKEAIKFLNQS